MHRFFLKPIRASAFLSTQIQHIMWIIINGHRYIGYEGPRKCQIFKTKIKLGEQNYGAFNTSSILVQQTFCPSLLSHSHVVSVIVSFAASLLFRICAGPIVLYSLFDSTSLQHTLLHLKQNTLSGNPIPVTIASNICY